MQCGLSVYCWTVLAGYNSESRRLCSTRNGSYGDQRTGQRRLVRENRALLTLLGTFV